MIWKIRIHVLGTGILSKFYIHGHFVCAFACLVRDGNRDGDGIGVWAC